MLQSSENQEIVNDHVDDVPKESQSCKSCGVVKTIDNSPKARSLYCKNCYNAMRRKPKVDHHCLTCNVLLTIENKRTNKECKSCRYTREREARRKLLAHDSIEATATLPIHSNNEHSNLEHSNLEATEPIIHSNVESKTTKEESKMSSDVYSVHNHHCSEHNGNDHADRKRLLQIESELNAILIELRAYLIRV